MATNAHAEMPTTYDPKATEGRIYEWWESQGYFRPETQFDKGLASRDQKPFVIAMPPPNVTGELHLGHAITASLEDLMIRYHRMKGVPALWVPGEDHAGIATQNVVERQIAKEGLTRHDLGREKFVERTWEWVRKYRHVIADQHRRLGASCDWQRERFTLDAGLSRAVREAFVHLYNKGLIYRGDYLIHWCPRCATTLSDLEVEHEDEEAGHLWYVRYPLVNDEWRGPAAEWGSGRWAEGATEFIEVATTRPETILGDTGVATNPKDERYQQLVGRTAVLPALSREIPIIADRRVDPEFGTGAVKVTPGHDPNDYEIGREHGLPIINAMNTDATMSSEAGPYAGLDRFDARQALVDDLEKESLLLRVEDHTHSPGRCYRCHTLVEPLVSTQWFVKIKPLAEPALEAVRDGRIRIIPERFEKVYYNWLENIRDWCISRQLWWGHRIPVWYCDACGKMQCPEAPPEPAEGLVEGTVSRQDPTECAHCGSADIRQDPDVLDTWFSSGLWPFSTLGWPDDTADLAYFYPTSVMETGYDILFFWVARMIMQGLEMTGEIPFHTVYLHGLIRDADGQKMSKSKGNVIDPLEVMDEYGTDALRFTLLTGSSPGNDMKLAYDRIEGNRNFANKIWNAARFVITNTSDFRFQIPEPEQVSDFGLDSSEDKSAIRDLQSAMALPDRWVLSRLNRLIDDATRLMDAYQFGEAGRQINEFFWSEFADWYIEMAKIRLYGGDEDGANTTRQMLIHVLDQTLRLLHPFMPFITEEVWQRLPHEGEALIIARWPEAGRRDADAEHQMALIQELIRGIRNARAEYNVEPGRRIAAIISADAQSDLLRQHAAIITTLARVDEAQLEIRADRVEPPARAASVVVGEGVQAYLPLAGMVDLDRERERLASAIEGAQADIAKAEGLLVNEQFTGKAPAAVVQRERDKLAEARDRLARLQERLHVLQT